MSKIIMKDLLMSYEAETGLHVNQGFNTIMDFLDLIESGKDDVLTLNCKNVHAQFFENPLNDKYFDTMEELYLHCKSIVK